jgi:iron complex outermembrane receptor protein
LTYQPAWRGWHQDANAVVLAGTLGLLLQKKYTLTDDFWTHELRLSSNPDSKLIWQAGALYYDNKLANVNAVTLPQAPIPGLGFSANSKKHTTAAGIFTEATYPFADSWRATAGARFDHTKVVSLQDYTANGVTKSIPPDQQKQSFDNTTFKIRGEHDLTPSNLL